MGGPAAGASECDCIRSHPGAVSCGDAAAPSHVTPVLAHAVGASAPHGHALLALGTAAVIVGAGALVIVGFRLEERASSEAGRWVGWGAALRVVGASLSVGAAAIHFSVIGVHAAVDPLEGVLFAVAAWAQLAAAVAAIVAPGRAALAALAAVNGVAVLAWLWSRALGLPFGADAWIPQLIGPADGLATVFEVGATVLGGALAFRRARAGEPRVARLSSAVTYVGAAVLAVAVATTVVLVGYPADDHEMAPAASEAHE